MDDSSNRRLIGMLQASTDQLRAIDHILAGDSVAQSNRPLCGPLLLNMSEAARFVGISRTSLWRLVKAGRLPRIEVLPGSYRVRREDVETLAGYRSGKSS